MNKNIKLLLDILLQQDDYLTASRLAEILGVTERSIRNYVRILNNAQSRGPLIIASNQGYKIQKKIYRESLKGQLFDKDSSNLLFRIAFILVNQRNYMSFDTLAVQLHYSIESIRSKVQLLFAKIKEIRIKVKLDSQIFIGIKVIGDENQKRLLLEQLIPIDSIKKEYLVEDIRQVLDYVADKDEIVRQIDTVDKILAHYHVTMDFVVYVKILCHLLIANYRLNNNHKITRDEITDRQNDEYPEYRLAVTLLSAQSRKVQSRAEIVALTNYLISLPINLPNNSTLEVGQEQSSIIEEALQSVEKYYSIPIYSNLQYRKQIINHIMRLLNPLEESIPIFNPYSNETKREYFFAYSIACFLYDRLQAAFDLSIPESEIAYLAIHIQLVLIEEAKTPIKTLLVYQGKHTEAELYRYKLERFFPNISIINVSTAMDNTLSPKYQLVVVIGFDEIKVNTNNVVYVSRDLVAKDIHRIQVFIDSISTFSLINKLDYYHMDERNSLSAIKFLLNKSGYGKMLPYFKKREAMSPTNIGNMVALPHPFLKGSATSAKIIVGINKSDISWGHQHVRLIIIYIPTADLKTNKNFFNEVYQHVSNFAVVYQLLQTKNKQDFIKIWNSQRRS